MATVVGLPTYDHPDVYTVKFKDDAHAEYSLSENILEATNVLCPIPDTNILPDWIKGVAMLHFFSFQV
jgi:hypothetical protein